MILPPVCPFPLSKFLHPEADYPVLAYELARVKAVNAVNGQHPYRAWEYAMALRALTAWGGEEPRSGSLTLCDVGGAGSRFVDVAQSYTAEPVLVIDPNLPPELLPREGVRLGSIVGYKDTVEQYAATQPHDQFDAVFALSVLEHVTNPRPFLRACRMILKPGGLLFLTMDAWNREGPDTAHFHWMRERIYDAAKLTALQQTLRDLGFQRFGTSDWDYPGDYVYNYSFSSLAMVKTL